MARNEQNRQMHTALVIYFPMFIATLSLLTSIFHGYLVTRNLDIVQRNVSRGEYLRTCREIIDTYFQIKLTVHQLAAPNVPSNGALSINASNMVSKFGALGTYLANFQDEQIRERYTALSGELVRVLAAAQQKSGGSVDKNFELADRLFSQMNNDCVRLAQVVKM